MDKHLIGLVQIKGQTYYEIKPAYPLGDEVKGLGARWNGIRGAWLLPPLQSSLESIKRLYGAQDFSVTEQVANRARTPFNFHMQDDAKVFRNLHQGALERLSDYQVDAVRFLLNSPHPGSLLGLGPGVGKTFTSLAAASGYDRVLIITPLSLMRNWENECQELLGFRPRRAYKAGPAPHTTKRQWVTTNYDTVYRHKGFVQPWDLIICDESILLKSKDAVRTKAIKKLREHAPHIWLLSGSPISRYVDDLYAQLEILYPKAFTSYWRFAREYCHVVTTKWADKVTGNKHNIDLRKEFRDMAYIRDRREVLASLPEYTFEDVYLEMGEMQTQVYDDLVHDFMTMLETGEEVTAVNKAVQLVRLQQAVSSPRNFGVEWPDASIKADYIEGRLDANEFELPMIIWTHWAPGAYVLHQRLQKAFPHLKTGITRSKDRHNDDIIESFKNGKLDILIMSLGIGKYGHTLTNAKTVLFHDKTWDGDAYIQALARVQRRGLMHRPHLLSLMVPGTTDDLLKDNLIEKSRNIHQLTNSDLATLLRGLDNARYGV